MLQHSGIGTYIRTVLRGVMIARPHWRYTILGDALAVRGVFPGARADVVQCTAPIYSIREQWELAWRIPRETTVYWAPHYNVPLLRRLRMVVTVHDLAHLRLAEYAGPIRQFYARTLFAFIKRRAAAVMFDSAFTRDEFTALLGTPRGASETIHLGPSPEFFEPVGAAGRAEPTSPYFVFVGNAKPHKNLALLLSAFELLRKRVHARLVLIGRIENLKTVDAASLDRLRRTADVEVRGEVSMDQLKTLVANAAALVLPSRYEGFGLPAVEAMALECPVIASRAASLPEVCKDAALFIDPSDATDLAGAMQRVLSDDALRRTMIERGRRRARELDIQQTVRRVIAVLDRVHERAVAPPA